MASVNKKFLSMCNLPANVLESAVRQNSVNNNGEDAYRHETLGRGSNLGNNSILRNGHCGAPTFRKRN